MKSTAAITIHLLVSLIFSLGTVQAFAEPLKYSISGISSGGFMAAQMGVIYSSRVEAVGVVAAGYYNCAQNHYQQALSRAMNLGIGYRSFFATEVDYGQLIIGKLDQSIKLSDKNPMYQAVHLCMKNPDQSTMDQKTLMQLEEHNLIDAIENIQKQRILLYQGGLDKVVDSKMLKKNIEFYQFYNIPQVNLKVFENPNGAHTFPTDNEDLTSCASQGIPYVSSCELDLAGEILKQALKNENLVRNTAKNSDLFLKVTQRVAGSHPDSISDYGYLAASPYCLKNPANCKVHVALHGCEMSDSFDPAFDARFAHFAKFGFLQMRKKAERPFWAYYLPVIEEQIPKMGTEKFAKLSGYVDYVNDQNKLMVLFPQTWITEKNFPGNPKGCWDWYGWTGSDYMTNQGQETHWLHQWVTRVARDPKKYLVP